ncbi:hypothetical protein KPR0928_09405 [Klebsiella pneumoniae subsp. pneumoniae KPR0928]|nr:hypothetical protein KPR0928_09405 [Klebsiella pneumoniae subsp. pneumoniae KPR0928]
MAHSKSQFVGLPAVAFVPRKAFHGHQTEAPRLDYSQRLQRLSRYPPHSQQAIFSGKLPDRETADIEHSHCLVFMPCATFSIFGFVAVGPGRICINQGVFFVHTVHHSISLQIPQVTTITATQPAMSITAANQSRACRL